MAKQPSQKPASGFDALDALSRVRPLTDAEVVNLRRAMKDRGERKGQRWWSSGDRQRLKRYLARGKRPAQIAPLMGRTERAIWRFMYRQGWTVRTVCNGSGGAEVRNRRHG